MIIGGQLREHRGVRLIPLTLILVGVTLSWSVVRAPVAHPHEFIPSSPAGPTQLQVAMRWAPVHYQDTDDSNARADYLAPFDYDGNWDATDNWDNLDEFDQEAVVYYSVVESCTHWFISYGFLHSRDWADGVDLFDDNDEDQQEHENDMEDALIMVRKTGGFGTLEAMNTQWHGNYLSFLPADSTLEATEGQVIHEHTIPMIEFPAGSGIMRPETAQEAKGHGLGTKGAGQLKTDFVGQSSNDGIVYYPAGNSEVPESGNDRYVAYRLEPFVNVNVDWSDPSTLWGRQRLNATDTYFKFGNFDGDDADPALPPPSPVYNPSTCGDGGQFTSCAEHAASPPWGQDDGGEAAPRGDIALDPADFVTYYFQPLVGSDFDQNYIDNRFVTDLQNDGWGPQPDGSVSIPPGYQGPALGPSLYDKVIGPDPDGDGVDTCQEQFIGTDPTDADTDGDGFSDGDELAAGTDPTDPASVPNRGPTAISDSYSMLAGDQLIVTAPGVLANDSDPDGDTLTAQLSTGPAHGSLAFSTDGSFVYMPSEDYYGTDSFTYRAYDDELLSANAIVTITVTASCAGRTPTLLGTNGPDKLTGTPEDDVILALGGNDKILGQSGNDTICSGGGNDVVNANSGNDSVYGGSGDDTIRGDKGSDSLDGGAGSADTCYGDEGIDSAINCEKVLGLP